MTFLQAAELDLSLVRPLRAFLLAQIHPLFSSVTFLRFMDDHQYYLLVQIKRSGEIIKFPLQVGE